MSEIYVLFFITFSLVQNNDAKYVYRGERAPVFKSLQPMFKPELPNVKPAEPHVIPALVPMTTPTTLQFPVHIREIENRTLIVTTSRIPIANATQDNNTASIGQKKIISLGQENVFMNMFYKIFGFVVNWLSPVEDYSKQQLKQLQTNLVDRVLNFVRRGLEHMETNLFDVTKSFALETLLSGQKILFDKLNGLITRVISLEDFKFLGQWKDLVLQEFTKRKQFVMPLMKKYIFSWIGPSHNVEIALRMLGLKF